MTFNLEQNIKYLWKYFVNLFDGLKLQKVYYGQTGRIVKLRFEEHVTIFGRVLTKKSNIAIHLLGE